jgi:hypothetical protein
VGSARARSPMKFAPRDGVAYFERFGFAAKDIHPLFREAIRLRRVPWWMRLFSFFPDPDPRNPGKARWSAIVRLIRSRG